jgi:phage anti-repressor protein
MRATHQPNKEESMNEITVTTAELGNEVTQTVNARDLHATLGSKRDYTSWIKSQIKRAGLIEGEDFLAVTFFGDGQSHQPKAADGRFASSVEYHLTVDAAKHVSMMSNTERGREVRKYFIRVERAFTASQHRIPTNATVVPKDLLKRCMYLGPKGRPTAQAKFLAKLMLPIIGQLGVTKEFGLRPSQLEGIERADRLALYAHQDQEFRMGAEYQMLQDQKVLEQAAKQKEKKRRQKQIANARAKLEQPA